VSKEKSNAKKQTAQAMEAYLRQARRGERIAAGTRRWIGRVTCIVIGISLYQLAESFKWFGISCH
jgi:hypothetical protein